MRYMIGDRITVVSGEVKSLATIRKVQKGIGVFVETDISVPVKLKHAIVFGGCHLWLQCAGEEITDKDGVILGIEGTLLPIAE